MGNLCDENHYAAQIEKLKMSGAAAATRPPPALAA
jgi:hypothetical protein